MEHAPLGFLAKRELHGVSEVETKGGMIFGVIKEHEGKFGYELWSWTGGSMSKDKELEGHGSTRV